MKIIYDDIIFELQKAGGISKYWGKLIENFSSSTKVDLNNIQTKAAKNNVFYPKDINFIKIPDLPIPLKIRRYLPILTTSGYDIFHSSYYRIPFISSKKLKQVVTVHDFMYEFFDSGLKKHIHVWQKRKAMLRADAIICVSEHTQQDLIKLYPEVNSKILHVVPNGVDKEFKVLKNSKTEKYLLYVGNRVGCKNFEFNLKLMSHSSFIQDNDFNLICVGGGKFSDSELSMFAQYNLADKVSQVMFIENEELNKLYNNAYALLFPSQYEGFGIPALEAQMAGCPVVYAKTSSLPEVMGYTELGFNLNDIDEASQKLELLQDEGLKETIIFKGVEHASKLSWENSASLTLKVYEGVLNNA